MFSASLETNTTRRDRLVTYLHNQAGDNQTSLGGIFPAKYDLLSGNGLGGSASPMQGGMFSILAMRSVILALCYRCSERGQKRLMELRLFTYSLEKKQDFSIPGGGGENGSRGGGGLSKGAIAGIVIGSILGVFFITFLIFLFLRRRRRRRNLQDQNANRGGVAPFRERLDGPSSSDQTSAGNNNAGQVSEKRAMMKERYLSSQESEIPGSGSSPVADRVDPLSIQLPVLPASAEVTASESTSTPTSTSITSPGAGTGIGTQSQSQADLRRDMERLRAEVEQLKSSQREGYRPELPSYDSAVGAPGQDL